MEGKSGSSEEVVVETVYKVEGGKSIRPRLVLKSGKISSVRIYGDFFFYPEEELMALEEALLGAGVGEVCVFNKTASTERKITLLGATPQDFTEAILKAING